MPSAEIITIGTEILLGEILDTNARFIALHLRNAGIDLFRTTTVGDNAQRIAQVIQEGLERSTIVITTGGLGPTVDDPTREAVALAMGVEAEFQPELWEQIQARFRRYNRPATDNNRRQAYIPKGAIALENPVGTAPIFIVERNERCVICLPGVPREMEYLLLRTIMPYIRQRYGLTGVIKTRTLHTAGVGESMIDDRIGDLEILANPTVGLAAHFGQVDVRIAAKAASEEEALELIRPVEDQLRQRLGSWIYGVDQETLEEIALKALQDRSWNLAVVEAGLGSDLIKRLANTSHKDFLGGEILPSLPSPEELTKHTDIYRRSRRADVGLGVAIYPAGERQDVFLVLFTPDGQQSFTRPYGGPPENAPRWATHHSLDILRKL